MSSGVYESEEYEAVETEDGDIMAIVSDEVAFQIGNGKYSVNPETVPVVLHTGADIVKGYCPNVVDPVDIYEAANRHIPEGAVFHFTQDEENWEKSVDLLLSEKREEITSQNGNDSEFRSTKPAYGKVSMSEDDCRRSFDATEGWDFN